MESRAINVSEIFEAGRFTPYQFLVCFLCFLVTFLDGFDLTLVGVALPKIADTLRADPKALGVALGISQFGPVVGAIVFGMLADRWGRKGTLIFATLLFGVFTFVTAFLTSVAQLTLYRFIAGVGLGGAVPSVLSLGAEYSPSRIRATVLTTMYAGVPGGSMVGGLCAAYLIPHYGWESLFVVGGLIPGLLCLVMLFFLPESLEFLAHRGNKELKIRKILSRVMPFGEGEEVHFTTTEKKASGGVPIARLFTEGRGVTTILLWFIVSLASYMVWIMAAWAPTLLRNSGATVQQYSVAYASLMFGAMVASICNGRLMDKMNPFRVLAVGFTLAFFFLAAFGIFAGGSFAVALILSIGCGMFINGSHTGTLAAATLAYPPSIRSTGIGWAYAIGKGGAAIAPAVGGFMLSRGWSPGSICGTNAVAGLLTAAFLIVLERWLKAERGRVAG